jgi:DNA polymerase-3 subunit delta'
MFISANLNQLYSTKLLGLDDYFNEMLKLYETKKFPKVLLLNGKKGIGKFTLVMHFINYIFSKNEKNSYDIEKKSININSPFYNLLSKNTAQDVIFIQTQENKNIKIENIRSLKATLSNSSLSNKPRFIIIDEVEFLNTNSANALLKTLESPSENNFFILINNQQADLIETISSRCLKTNIFLKQNFKNDIINYLIEEKNIENLTDLDKNLSPGLFLRFNEIYLKYKINKNDNIFIKLNILINGYKKEKEKSLINLAYFLIDHTFLNKIQNNKKEIEFLLDTKSSITKIISDFVQFNLNVNSVLNSIKIKLNNV